MSTTPATEYPTLVEDAGADVVVIGAGMVGICTAWELARRGRSVMLVEATRIASGTTGHTTAKLTAQHTLIYDRIRASLGAATGRTHARAQLDAIEWVVGTADNLGIDCDIERRAALTYATDPDDVDQIRAEVDAARDAGLPATFVTETGLPFPVSGAIRVEEQVQFHPRRFLLGLAEDFVRSGGRIVEQTRVVGLADGGGGVQTAGGQTIAAAEVVVATQWPIIDRLKVFTRMTPKREFVVAAPLPVEQDPAGMYITPAGGTRSVRTAPYGDGQRLLIVTGEHMRPGTGDAAAHLQQLTEWIRTQFGVEKIAYQWAAQDHNTTDGLPYIGRLDDHLWVATGFGGWGMTNGAAAGQLLSSLMDGDHPQWADVVDPARLHPLAEAVELTKAGIAVADHVVADRVRTFGSVADIAPGAGAVVRVGGKPCAVFRDSDGTVSAVSATCTHLGCVVGFNDAERSWDCPCHGSRFALDGSVLQGPAVSPLASVPMEDAT
jgi:glycine/D-amino acid oxidase-like deaminating enzyme